MPPTRKRKPAPSRKKSLGYYAKVKKGGGTGKKAGGGMTCLLYTSDAADE